MPGKANKGIRGTLSSPKGTDIGSENSRKNLNWLKVWQNEETASRFGQTLKSPINMPLALPGIWKYLHRNFHARGFNAILDMHFDTIR